MISVGFTGTKKGMAAPQELRLRDMLTWYHEHGASEFHHGDCVGADAEAAEIAREVGYRLVCHPAEDKSKRAMIPSDEVHKPKPYLDRNRDIVDACDILFAAPHQPQDVGEVTRSGTWATVRYARKVERRTTTIWPDGERSHYGTFGEVTP